MCVCVCVACVCANRLATLATGDEEAKVLMVVQPNERNVFDQRLIAAKLWEKHGAGSLVRSRSALHPLTQGSQLS